MIVDTHTHFYDPGRPQGVPWPPPDNPILYRRVLPEDLRALAVPEGVTGTIVVEASPWVEDNQWLLDLAANDPYLLGIVGNLDPLGEDFPRHLDRFAANPLFRGIRVGMSAIRAGDAFVRSARVLAERDLSLDVLLRPEGLPDVAAFAARVPELRVVLNHVAEVRIEGGAPDAAWVDGLRRVAENPRVFCKVSGMPELTRQPPAPTDPAFYAPVVDALWDAFGAERLLFGSNWPVCERYATYATVVRIAKTCIAAHGADAVERFFWRNAQAVYRWPERQV